MACNIVAPTLLSCNDLTAGAKKLEVVAWSPTFDESTATFTEIPLEANYAYGKETGTADPVNKTISFEQEVMFKVAGIGNFTSYEDFIKSILIIRITLFDDTKVTYGLFRGLSGSGERNTGENMTDFQGSVLTFKGVSPTAAVVTPHS